MPGKAAAVWQLLSRRAGHVAKICARRNVMMVGPGGQRIITGSVNFWIQILPPTQTKPSDLASTVAPRATCARAPCRQAVPVQLVIE